MFFAEARSNRFTGTLTADGSTTPYRWGGGPGTFDVEGAFGSGTIKLEFSQTIGGSFHDLDGSGADLTFTANAGGNFTIREGVYLRATLSGATAPNLNIVIAENKS